MFFSRTEAPRMHLSSIRSSRRSLEKQCLLSAKQGEEGGTYLSLAGHLNPRVEKLIKVLAELPRGGRQLPALAPRGVHNLPSRLVQVGRHLVELALRLLERLGAGGQLQGEGGIRKLRLCPGTPPSTRALPCRLPSTTPQTAGVGEEA